MTNDLSDSLTFQDQHQYVRNIVYRYFYILSSIARGGHVKRGVQTESSAGSTVQNSVAFPTIVRQRAANYLQDLVCMQCFTDYFMTSHYHVNELMELSSPPEGISALNQVDWSRIRSLQSSVTSTELVSNLISISTTSPNQSHQLVVYVLSLLPLWEESVVAPVVRRIPSKKKSSPTQYIQLCRVSGYLTKRGGNIATWKRRFAILENRKLRYFVNHGAYEAGEDPLGCFEISVDDTTCEPQGILVRE
jgi:hypothetical protein